MTLNATLQSILDLMADKHRPLILFDDDPDGTIAFTLMYRHFGEGKGIILKTPPTVGEGFDNAVETYSPDIIFILDKPQVDQDFFDRQNVPVVWIDHHSPQKRKKVLYLNPREYDDADNRPTTYWAYRLVKKDLWLAAVGCVADWHFPPDIVDPVRQQYPDLLPEGLTTAPQALFESPIGILARVVAFNLKGSSKDAMTSVKVLTRINSPYEILRQESAKGKYLWRRYEKRLLEYGELLKSIKVTRSPLIVHTYTDAKTSFTAEASNELLYKHPDKVIIIARQKDGEMKCSLRSASVPIRPILDDALKQVDGYGGGHEFACGACVKEADFEKFVELIRQGVKAAAP